MKIAINLSEPTNCDYIYIDNNNCVHLLVPLMSGNEIGLDNTCYSNAELSSFSRNVQAKLTDYRNKLSDDINLLRRLDPSADNQRILHLKESRLNQINSYLALLTHGIPRSLDDGRIQAFLRAQNNCLAMRLYPAVPDLVSYHPAPLFVLQRDHYNRESFGALLRNAFHSPTFIAALTSNRKTYKERVVRQIIRDYRGELNFANMQAALSRAIPQLDFTRTRDLNNPNMSQEYLENTMAITPTDGIADYLDGFLSCCADPVFWEEMGGAELLLTDASLLKVNANQRSIRIQFFMAQVNLYCHAYGKLRGINFGEVLDRDAAQIVAKIDSSLRNGTNIFDVLFEIIHEKWPATRQSLRSEDKEKIIANFRAQFLTIENSPHFDEFYVYFPGARGDFVTHKNRISFSFLEFVGGQYSGIFNEHNQSYRLLTGQMLSPNNSHIENRYVLEYTEIPQQILNSGNIADLKEFLCTEIPGSNQRLFEFLPTYSVQYLVERNLLSQRLKTEMRHRLQANKHDLVEDFFSKITNTASFHDDAKILHHYPMLRPEQLNPTLIILRDVLSRSQTGSVLAFFSSQQKQINNALLEISKLRVANKSEEHLKQLFALLKMLQTLSASAQGELKTVVDNAFATLNRHDELVCCDTVINSSGTFSDILAWQNSIMPFAEIQSLQYTWWLPENREHLNLLCSLPDFWRTPTAIAFFNTLQPNQLDEALARGLSVIHDANIFSLEVNLEEIRSAAQQILNEERKRELIQKINLRLDELVASSRNTKLNRLKALAEYIDERLLSNNNNIAALLGLEDWWNPIGLQKLQGVLQFCPNNQLSRDYWMKLSKWKISLDRDLNNDDELPLPRMPVKSSQAGMFAAPAETAENLSKGLVYNVELITNRINKMTARQPINVLLNGSDQRFIDEQMRNIESKRGKLINILQACEDEATFKRAIICLRHGCAAIPTDEQFIELRANLAFVHDVYPLERDNEPGFQA